jgi:hypothetical protein
MSQQTMTLEQIRQTGIDLLARHLGPVGMIRFFQQSETGQGDYTTERHQWLGNKDVKTLAEEIIAKRKASH